MSILVNEDDATSLGQGQQCFVMVDQDTVEPIHSILTPSHQDVTNSMFGNQMQTNDTDPLNCDDDEDDVRYVKIIDQQKGPDIRLKRKLLLGKIQTEVTKDPLTENIGISDQKISKVRKILSNQISSSSKPMPAARLTDLIPSPIAVSTPLSKNYLEYTNNKISDTNEIGMKTSTLPTAAVKSFKVKTLKHNKVSDTTEIGIMKTSTLPTAVVKSFTVKTLKQTNNHTGTNIVLEGKKSNISDTHADINNTESQCDMPMDTQYLGTGRQIEVREEFDNNEKKHINVRRNPKKNKIYGSLIEMSDESEGPEGESDYGKDDDEDYDGESDEDVSDEGKYDEGKGDEDEDEDLDEDIDEDVDEDGDVDVSDEDVDDEEGDDDGGDDEDSGKHEVSNTNCCQVHAKKRQESLQVYHCPACKKTFPNFTQLEKHAKDQHDVTNFEFPCDICGLNFTRPDNLSRHKATKHSGGEKVFECEHCQRKFIRKDALLQHVSVHVKQQGEVQLKNTVAKNFSIRLFCPSCKRSFANESELSKHRTDDVTCEDCKVIFDCKALLRDHINKEHYHSLCSECGKEFSNKHKLYLHRLSHTPKFVCEICNKGFTWKSTYMNHMAYHTGESPELCDICGKSYPHKGALSNHKRQDHYKENRKDICPICGKSLACKAKLVEHMRSHTGEKPFLCDLCSSAFATKNNLVSHVKTVHSIDLKICRQKLPHLKKIKTIENSIIVSDSNSLNQLAHVEENVQDLSNKETTEMQQFPEQVHDQVAGVYDMLYNYP